MLRIIVTIIYVSTIFYTYCDASTTSSSTSSSTGTNSNINYFHHGPNPSKASLTPSTATSTAILGAGASVTAASTPLPPRIPPSLSISSLLKNTGPNINQAFKDVTNQGRDQILSLSSKSKSKFIQDETSKRIKFPSLINVPKLSLKLPSMPTSIPQFPRLSQLPTLPSLPKFPSLSLSLSSLEQFKQSQIIIPSLSIISGIKNNVENNINNIETSIRGGASNSSGSGSGSNTSPLSPSSLRRVGGKVRGIQNMSTKPKKRRNNTGFYYGIQDDVFWKQEEIDNDNNNNNNNNNNNPSERGQQSQSQQQRQREQQQWQPNFQKYQQQIQQSIDDHFQSNQQETRNENRSDASSSSSSQSDTLSSVMGETLSELREMREDIMALREEMHYMKEEMRRNNEYKSSFDNEYDENEIDYDNDYGSGSGNEYNPNREEYEYKKLEQKKQNQIGSIAKSVTRQREFDKISKDVEKWAHRLLFEEDGEEHGWKEVSCNKMVRKKFNRDGMTRCYIKWMKDSRQSINRSISSQDEIDDETEYPCIKCFATINSPIETVCEYLSQESNMAEYNDLVIDYKDVESISPQSKITWSQCPQILFIKPRDFVTFCHHRWRKDGTQIVVNQACEHQDIPGNTEDSDGKVCRAHALRGANFISRDPHDPSKTRMAILAHANPGGGIPQWAMKTAVNAVAPIEPFKLFSRIDEKVCAFRNSISTIDDQQKANMVNSVPGRQVQRPAGLSQLGYACFWPSVGQSSSNKYNSERDNTHGEYVNNEYIQQKSSVEEDNDDSLCIEASSN